MSPSPEPKKNPVQIPQDPTIQHQKKKTLCV